MCVPPKLRHMLRSAGFLGATKCWLSWGQSQGHEEGLLRGVSFSTCCKWGQSLKPGGRRPGRSKNLLGSLRAGESPMSCVWRAAGLCTLGPTCFCQGGCVGTWPVFIHPLSSVAVSSWEGTAWPFTEKACWLTVQNVPHLAVFPDIRSLKDSGSDIL